MLSSLIHLLLHGLALGTLQLENRLFGCLGFSTLDRLSLSVDTALFAPISSGTLLLNAVFAFLVEGYLVLAVDVAFLAERVSCFRDVDLIRRAYHL